MDTDTEVNKISKAENVFCMYKLGRATAFDKCLIDCCFAAGKSDFAKLKITFPLARVVSDYKYVPNYWHGLVGRWNNQPNRNFLHKLRA